MSEKCIVGIDPGLDGGIAVLTEVVEAFPMPVMPTGSGARRTLDLPSIRELIAGADLVIIERQQAFPRDSKAGAFKTGEGFGMLKGLLCGLGIPHQIVSPQTWQKDFAISSQRGDTKAQAGLACQQLFPGIDLRKSGRATKPHDGKIDALLIAEHGRRKVNGE